LGGSRNISLRDAGLGFKLQETGTQSLPASALLRLKRDNPFRLTLFNQTLEW
jgi:hypothetical protein